MSIELSIYEDFLAQADVETPATTTGDWSAATGATTFAFRVALTPTGAAVSAALSATAAERSATAGRYHYTFDASDLETALGAYVGRTVYVILSQSGNLDMKYWPVLVTDRTAGTIP